MSSRAWLNGEYFGLVETETWGPAVNRAGIDDDCDGYIDDDCDDLDPEVSPGAAESCDELDDDCDGLVDDDDDSVEPDTWFPDADGDGYGDASGTPAYACNGPTGHVNNNRDCSETTLRSPLPRSTFPTTASTRTARDRT